MPKKNHLEEAMPNIADAYSELIELLMAANAGSDAVAIGSDWPAFFMPDNEGRFINSTELLRAEPLVVSLNRGHWCKYETTFISCLC